MTGTGRGSIVGYPPTLVIGGGNPESVKYGKLWTMPEYREHAPGENLSIYFLKQAKPKDGAHVIDFGCGTGRGAMRLRDAGLKVTMLDFARNCLDEPVRARLGEKFMFRKHDIEQPIPLVAEYGFCSDVMEHIPPNKVNTVLNNILRAASHNFFAISTVDDVWGKLIDEKLHLSIHPYEWWLAKFQEFNCVVHWSEKIGSYAFFYVTVWEDAQITVDTGELNVTEELIKSNVKHNCSQGWQQVIPHPQNEMEAMILGGGPSLKHYVDDIRQKREEGVKLITLNGTYNWAIEQGLTPSAQVIVDARDFNARFTKPVVDGCKYLLSSQCHPSVFDGLPKDRTYLWHSMSELIGDIIKENYPAYWAVPGGSTVLLRAIPLLRMLGFYKFHLYGCDSCLDEGEHHSYAQPENDDRTIIPVMLTGGKIFMCHAWMAAQAKQFITLIKKMGDLFELIVYGNGLLAHIINTGAELAPEQEE